MEQEQLTSILESLLFVAGRPQTAKELAKILELDESAVKSALERLTNERKNSGIILLDNDGEYQLSTNSHNSTQVKNFLNAELREKLTDATVEVLAIIAYRQPISKAEIEAIRGVNSQYSLRNLLMRGLIEKIQNPGDARSFLYQTTTEFLMHLGLNSDKDLPEFEKLVEHIKLPQTPGLAQTELPAENPENIPVPQNQPEILEPVSAAADSNEEPPKDDINTEEFDEEDEASDDDEDEEE